MERSRTWFLVFGGLVFLMSAQHIVGYLAQRSDIWWTPKTLSPALNEVADRVEVYVRDVRLDDLVKSARLQLSGSEGANAVTASEIRFRFNNWDRVRAQAVWGLLISAAFLGASGVCLFLGILDWVPGRKARGTE